MKINKIKINAYGNVEDKEINLKDGMNIIYGENESGKSTILSYIVNTFYGISKTKDGKEISDYDKYKPWNSEEFSGRMSYELDNGEKYEVFRDFKKKNPTIYNSNLEDITKQFEIDKKDGSKFFQEQTGVDKQMYLSTVVSMQQEVRLDEKNQNILVQKIANLAGTGEDNVSYKKALTKLQEKIRDEIGTNKTSQKPINILEKEIAEINKKIQEIKPYQNKKYDLENEKEAIAHKLEELELQRELLQELINSLDEHNGYIKEKDIKEANKRDNLLKISNLKEEELKIKKENEKVQKEIQTINKEIETKEKEEENLKAKIAEISENTIEYNNEEKKNKNIIYIIIAAVLILTSIATAIAKNYYVAGILGAVAIIDLLFYTYKKIKGNQERKTKQEKNNELKEKNISQKSQLEQNLKQILEEIIEQKAYLQNHQNVEKELTNNISMLTGQIMLLENNNKQLEEELEKIQLTLHTNTEAKKKEIVEKYKDKLEYNYVNKILGNNDIKSTLSDLKETISSEKIRLKGVEIEENTILPQLDNMVNQEEKLQSYKEQYKELKKYEETINIAIENLEEAYEEMKNNVTPKFTSNLSSSIEKISNNKYNKVSINDENGMIVENKRGEYIEASKLSTGTIDQLYLALRLSMINDLSQESLPIILDETFAYFDDNRLKESLKYLAKELENHQAIIFTCSNREIETLENLNVEYNLVTL